MLWVCLLSFTLALCEATPGDPQQQVLYIQDVHDSIKNFQLLVPLIFKYGLIDYLESDKSSENTDAVSQMLPPFSISKRPREQDSSQGISDVSAHSTLDDSLKSQYIKWGEPSKEDDIMFRLQAPHSIESKRPAQDASEGYHNIPTQYFTADESLEPHPGKWAPSKEIDPLLPLYQQLQALRVKDLRGPKAKDSSEDFSNIPAQYFTPDESLEPQSTWNPSEKTNIGTRLVDQSKELSDADIKFKTLQSVESNQLKVQDTPEGFSNIPAQYFIFDEYLNAPYSSKQPSEDSNDILIWNKPSSRTSVKKDLSEWKNKVKADPFSKCKNAACIACCLLEQRHGGVLLPSSNLQAPRNDLRRKWSVLNKRHEPQKNSTIVV